MERSPPPQSGLHLFRVADIHKGVRDHSEAPQLQSRRHLEFLHITWRLPFSRFLDESWSPFLLITFRQSAGKESFWAICQLDGNRIHPYGSLEA